MSKLPVNYEASIITMDNVWTLGQGHLSLAWTIYILSKRFTLVMLLGLCTK